MALEKLNDQQINFLYDFVIKIPSADGGEITGEAAWFKLQAALEPNVTAALKTDHTEATKIRGAWGMALDKAEAGDFAGATTIAKRMEALLGKDAAPSDIPTNVVAFQKSRIMWVSAKRDMQSGLSSFRKAVADQASDDEDLKDILKAADTLVAEFDAFDTRLEDQLDQITQTPEGSERTKLKSAAKVALSDYMATLNNPFFSVIDNNPFVSVNVAARGRQSLSVISAALS